MYRYTTLAWKAVKAAAVVGIIALTAMPDQEIPLTESAWRAFGAAFAAAFFRAAVNVWKHRNTPGNPLYTMPISMIFALPFCACLLTGCATYSYDFKDFDGSSMSMRDSVPIFMKRDLSNAQAAYSWDGDGAGQWAVGGEAVGTDGTQLLKTIEALVGLVQLMQAQAGSAEASGP